MKKLLAVLFCVTLISGCGIVFKAPAPSVSPINGDQTTPVATESIKAKETETTKTEETEPAEPTEPTNVEPKDTEQSVEEANNKARVIPVPLSAKKLSFETTDLDYNDVDSSIFSGYEITMVNFWATWCGPCVYEMPYIAEVYKALPENANIITVCSDAADSDEAYNDALQILSDSEAEFKTLFPDVNLYGFMDEYVTAIPTTVFVNANGQIVGEMEVGVPRGDIVQSYLDIINEKLAK